MFSVFIYHLFISLLFFASLCPFYSFQHLLPSLFYFVFMSLSFPLFSLFSSSFTYSSNYCNNHFFAFLFSYSVDCYSYCSASFPCKYSSDLLFYAYLPFPSLYSSSTSHFHFFSSNLSSFLLQVLHLLSVLPFSSFINRLLSFLFSIHLFNFLFFSIFLFCILLLHPRLRLHIYHFPPSSPLLHLLFSLSTYFLALPLSSPSQSSALSPLPFLSIYPLFHLSFPFLCLSSFSPPFHFSFLFFFSIFLHFLTSLF